AGPGVTKSALLDRYEHKCRQIRGCDKRGVAQNGATKERRHRNPQNTPAATELPPRISLDPAGRRRAADFRGASCPDESRAGRFAWHEHEPLPVRITQSVLEP